MGHDFDGALVHIILARLFSFRTSWFEDLGRQWIGDDFFGLFNVGFDFLACRVHFLDRHQSRLPVKIGIGEKTGSTSGVIENVEKELPVVVLDAGAATDDLLEFGHGVDGAGDHDVLAGLNVYASSQ